MFKTGGEERRGKGRERKRDRQMDGWPDKWMDGQTDTQAHSKERERERERTLTWEWHVHWPHRSQKSWCQRSHRSTACAGWPQTDDHPAKQGCQGLVLQSADWVGSPHPPSQSAPWLLLPSLHRKETRACVFCSTDFTSKIFFLLLLVSNLEFLFLQTLWTSFYPDMGPYFTVGWPAKH